jgi:hypothetical protein
MNSTSDYTLNIPKTQLKSTKLPKYSGTLVAEISCLSARRFSYERLRQRVLNLSASQPDEESVRIASSCGLISPRVAGRSPIVLPCDTDK